MRKIFVFIIALSFLNNIYSQQVWPKVNNTARPLTRWWWMGNAVDGKNIQSLLKEYSRIGIGGVEIVPIYGAKGFEHRYINYLSPLWLKMLDTTITEAKKHNMLVDISVGSGWPIGGPDVSMQDAATKMEILKFELKAGESFNKKIEAANPKLLHNKEISLSALMAYSNTGQAVDLIKLVSPGNVLNWSPQKDDWTIIALLNSKTQQKVKRASPGGEGYTLDHFNSDAVNNYIKYFDRHFGNKSRGVRALFNDSYEVFNADWTTNFLNEFKRLRGYDLKPYLLQVLSDKIISDSVGRIKSDFRETMSDLILNNFTRSLTSWAHSKNTVFLNQAHGSPGNILDLYAAVDIPETETFGSSIYPIPGLRRDMYDPRVADTEPLMFKFASSAAHVMGHNFTSSETHTWLTEHFKTNLALCKPEAENLFLSGVNQLMFHGTTYSPADVAWPGWLFYASVNFTPANPLWSHLKGYNDFITRSQSVLQAGQPDNEILLYWPVYDLWNSSPGIDLPFRAHNTDVWIHGTDLNEKSKQLKKTGYSFDFVSDDMLQKSFVNNNNIQVAKNGPGYKTVIVPAIKFMPLSTLKRLVKLAEDGSTIIFTNLPEDVPGLNNLEERRKEFLSEIHKIKPQLLNGVAKIGKGKITVTNDLINTLLANQLKGEELAASGLQFIRRKMGNEYFYYIVNHTPLKVDSYFTFNRNAGYSLLLDPQTGTISKPAEKIETNKRLLRLQLKPGESIILKQSAVKALAPHLKYFNNASKTIVLAKNWQLKFTSGGPVLPAPKKINELKLWSDISDSAYQDFSGTAIYSTVFSLNKSQSKEYLLQLHNLYETARVIINGREAGYIYSVPYELRVGKFLKQGNNTIEIEVCNLMANRIRYMDRNKMIWRNYHEINFVNKDYKEFDASAWKTMPSGLAGPVEIIEF